MITILANLPPPRTERLSVLNILAGAAPHHSSKAVRALCRTDPFWPIGLRKSVRAYAGVRSSPAGERVRSFTIIMTAPNELCARFHNRMPAILQPAAWQAWLGEEPAELPQIKAPLGPYPAEDIVCWPVSPRIGNARNNDPGLVEPVVLN
jgi:putative SOS response-associated peptidase YedK